MKINLLRNPKPSGPAEAKQMLQARLNTSAKELKGSLELLYSKGKQYPRQIDRVEANRKIIRSLQREAGKATEIVNSIKIENNVITNKTELQAAANAYAELSSFRDLWVRFANNDISLGYFVFDLANRISAQIKDIKIFADALGD